MSHIPSSAMPHAQAQDEPPLASNAPATATGNRQGGEADRASRSAGKPTSTTGSPQPAVDGTVTAHGSRSEPRTPPTRERSRMGIAALALGGVALVGGVAALLFPVLRSEPKTKTKKRRRRKRNRS